MAYRISPDFRLGDYPQEVGRLWRSRNEEPPEEVFDYLPDWMALEQTSLDDLIDLQRVIPQVLETMTKREQKLLWCRFWAEYTLDEVGTVFSLTKERIRQIEAKALRKLKHPSRSDLMLPFVDICPIKIRREKERAEQHQRWLKEYDEKRMLEWYTKYMEDRLIKQLLELRENT